MEWLYSLFGFKHPSRSSRVRDKLADFAIHNDLTFDKGNYSWTSSSGARCLILDVDSTSYDRLSFSVLDEILNFVCRTSLIGNERYLIICIDVDQEYGHCINIPDEHVDPCPHVYVYNYLDNMNMEDLLGQLGNRVISLGRDGYYGPVRKVFTCYGNNSFITNTDESITNPLFNSAAHALFSSPPYAEGHAVSVDCNPLLLPLALECMVSWNR
jgi:hypothetical protein